MTEAPPVRCEHLRSDEFSRVIQLEFVAPAEDIHRDRAPISGPYEFREHAPKLSGAAKNALRKDGCRILSHTARFALAPRGIENRFGGIKAVRGVSFEVNGRDVSGLCEGASGRLQKVL